MEVDFTITGNVHPLYRCLIHNSVKESLAVSMTNKSSVYLLFIFDHNITDDMQQ